MLLLHLIPFHALSAPIALSAVAVFVAIAGDWRGGVFLLVLIGVSAGWRRWPQKWAMALALGYILIGLVAQAVRQRAAPGLGDALGWSAACVFLVFIGHAIGAAFREATGAALDAGKRVAELAASSVADALGPSSRRAVQDGGAASAVAAQARIVSALQARAQGATQARASNPARPPRGWAPTVSPRRRGLFS